MSEQGSDRWLNDRLGIITASRFKAACSTGETRDTYMAELIAELFTGASKQPKAPSLDWGTQYEAKARELYVFETGSEVVQTGVCYLADNPMIGSSPDGLVGEAGLIEIKCPYTSEQHVKAILMNRIPPDYRWQIDGNLLVTGRKWCDYVSYDPRLPGDLSLFIKRVKRDEKRMDELQGKLLAFAGELEKHIERFIGDL